MLAAARTQGHHAQDTASGNLSQKGPARSPENPRLPLPRFQAFLPGSVDGTPAQNKNVDFDEAD